MQYTSQKARPRQAPVHVRNDWCYEARQGAVGSLQVLYWPGRLVNNSSRLRACSEFAEVSSRTFATERVRKHETSLVNKC
eukprot:11439082-Alexandrium_andersonii.AAC.1